MKPDAVPTAPSERAKRTKNKNQSTSQGYLMRSFVVLILCIIISFIVGFIGSLLARSYPTNWPYADKILVSDSSSPEVIFVDSNGAAPNQELIDVLLNRQSKTIVSIFSSQTTTYSDETELAKGIIISSDGWLVVPTTAIADYNSFTVVLSDNRVFVTEKILEDDYSGITYAKINASQLPVIDFKSDKVVLGEPIVLYTRSVASGDRVAYANIENISFSNKEFFSTKENNLVYLMDYESRPEYLGSPVFDMMGNMMGMNLLDHQILPVQVISNSIYSVFTYEKLMYHNLDFTYLPLYRKIDTDNGPQEIGVEVITINSGTEKIKIGDIITSVNGTDLDVDNDLANVLSEINLESNIEFKILRNGKSLTIEFKLD